MAPIVENIISSKLYAEMAKNSACAKTGIADNKQVEVFNSANNPVKDKVDYFISEKGTEEISDKKEKTKNIWKAIGLTTLGIVTVAGSVLLAKKIGANSKKMQKIVQNSAEDAGEYMRKNWDILTEGTRVDIHSKNNLRKTRIVFCRTKLEAEIEAKRLSKSRRSNEIITREGCNVEVYTNDNLKHVKSIWYKTPEEAKKAAEDLLNFNEPLVMYKEGIYTVIEAKRGNKIDLEKIERLVGGNIVVRYNSPEEAKQAAKDLIMKQFAKPVEEQIECGISVEWKNILGINYGNHTSMRPIGLQSMFDCQGKTIDLDFLDDYTYESLKRRTIDFYHNHPYIDSTDMPLSDDDLCSGDLGVLIREGLKSITAYNHLGEYNCAEVTDLAKAAMTSTEHGNEFLHELQILNKIQVLGKEKATKFASVAYKCKCIEDMRKPVPKELSDEYRSLYREYRDKSRLVQMLSQEIAKWKHDNYSELLPKYGIKYTTNYSNLMNV